MHELKPLSDIANVRLGLAFKSAIKDEGSSGTCYLIQSKDITSDGNIELDELARVIPEISPQNHYLQQGDILLRLRGPVFSAAIFDEVWPMPTVATNQTAVIRCDHAFISPYYLQWYLNSPLGQRYFKGTGEGTNINKLTGKIISNMQLALPPLEKQKQIEDIYKNWLEQKETYKRLIENGDMYFGQLCMLIHEEKLK